jgi:hypothetical protein
MNARALVAAAFVAALAAACGSDPNTLTNGEPTPGTGGGSGNGNGGGTGNGGGVQNPNGAPTAPPAPADNNAPPGVNNNKAKVYFVQTVYPSLMGTCGACHNPPGVNGAPPWLSSSSASDAYTSIEARGYIVPSSMLIKKGAHEGPALTSEQTTSVTPWLQMDADVRGAAAPVDLLAKLGTCVNQTLFNAIQLQNLRTTPRTNENPNTCTGCNNAPCQTCHESGEYAMHSNFGKLGTNTLQALQANGTSPEGVFLISKYISTNGTTLIAANGIQNKAKTVATGPRYSHPMFTVSTTMDTAITAFANDIITKYNAKQCGQ